MGVTPKYSKQQLLHLYEDLEAGYTIGEASRRNGIGRATAGCYAAEYRKAKELWPDNPLTPTGRPRRTDEQKEVRRKDAVARYHKRKEQRNGAQAKPKASKTSTAKETRQETESPATPEFQLPDGEIRGNVATNTAEAVTKESSNGYKNPPTDDDVLGRNKTPTNGTGGVSNGASESIPLSTLIGGNLSDAQIGTTLIAIKTALEDIRGLLRTNLGIRELVVPLNSGGFNSSIKEAKEVRAKVTPTEDIPLSVRKQQRDAKRNARKHQREELPSVRSAPVKVNDDLMARLDEIVECAVSDYNYEETAEELELSVGEVTAVMRTADFREALAEAQSMPDMHLWEEE